MWKYWTSCIAIYNITYENILEARFSELFNDLFTILNRVSGAWNRKQPMLLFTPITIDWPWNDSLPTSLPNLTIVLRMNTSLNQETYNRGSSIKSEALKVLQSDSTQTIDHIQKCFRQKFQCSRRPPAYFFIGGGAEAMSRSTRLVSTC